MKFTSDKCFVDTNVFFYAFGESMGIKKQRSQGVINALVSNNKLFLSTQVLQELHFNLVKKAGVSTENSHAVLKALGKNHVVVNDTRIIHEAIEVQKSHQFSFWDSLILAAALNVKCRYLISEDLNAGQRLGKMEILNPYL